MGQSEGAKPEAAQTHKRKGKESLINEGKKAKTGEEDVMETYSESSSLAEAVKQPCQGL